MGHMQTSCYVHGMGGVCSVERQMENAATHKNDAKRTQTSCQAALLANTCLSA